jgi:DNA-binding ferritin-like protein (Dps family)
MKNQNFFKDFVLKIVGDKRRWRAYKARTKALPPAHRATVEAVERYLMHFGPMEEESAASLLEDVADLFERAAADNTPIRQIVGDDPVDFVEALARNYVKGGYVDRERERLVSAIRIAAGETD